MALVHSWLSSVAELANSGQIADIISSNAGARNRDSNVLFDVEAVRATGKGNFSTGKLPLEHMLFTELDGQIYVTIDAAASNGNGAELLEEFGSLGLLNGSSYGGVVSGLLPVDNIGGLEGLTTLGSARPTLATTNVGATTSQDVAALQVDEVFSQLGLDGTGVKIGILSDSFDASTSALTTYADDIATGDLPPGVTIIEDLLPGPSIDEGRAMAQLIHDIAPGAELLFATAFNGAAGFANNIDALVAAGADIIVDDIIYFAEPMFQDGIIAQAAANSVVAGVPYLSSAGNNGTSAYFREWQGTTGQSVFGGTTDLFDWDPGAGEDGFLEITVPPFSIGTVFLQWTQPYLSTDFGGFAGPTGTSPGSSSDLDIVVWNEDLTGIFDLGAAFNVGDDPLESVFVDNFSADPLTVNISIEKFLGPDPEALRFVTFDTPVEDLIQTWSPEYEEGFNTASVYGHAAAEGVLGVGAAPWFYTPEFGVVDGTVPEDFTSLGGSFIYFDEDGNPLPTPEFREGVDFTATDGGNTTFFGGDVAFPPGFFPGGDPDPDSFGNFFGTSAAAPNAAAVAALLLEADPTLTPADIETILESTADDITPPFELTNGFSFIPEFIDRVSTGVEPGDDPRTGAGLINAASAVDQVAGADTKWSITANQTAEKEGAQGETQFFSFTISVSEAFLTDQIVDLTITGTGADPIEGIDLGGPPLPDFGQVPLSAGETEVEFQVPVAGDFEIEGDEEMTLTLSNPTAGMIHGTADSASSIILNDDADCELELVELNDWFNPAWGGGYRAVFELEIGPDGIVDGDSVSAWLADLDINGAGTFQTGWVEGLNATATFDAATGTFSTVGQSLQRELVAGDVIRLGVVVDGAGYSEGHIDCVFSDADIVADEVDPEGLALDVSNLNDWSEGAVQNVTISNTGAIDVNGWTVKLDLEPAEIANIDINNIWGAEYEIVGDDIFFTPVSWTAPVVAGQSENFGFQVDVLDNTGVPWNADDFSFV